MSYDPNWVPDKGPKAPKVREPKKPRKPRPPKRPRRKKPRISGGPLSFYKASNLNRSRYDDGSLALSLDAPYRIAIFDQSPYVFGDHKTPNSHYYKSLRVTLPYGKISYLYPYGLQQEMVGAMGGFIGAPKSFIVSDISNTDAIDFVKRKASERFYSSLRDSDLNLAVDIAEWKQASSMIADTSLKVRELAMRCRKFSNFVWYVQMLIFTKYGNNPQNPMVKKLRKLIPRYHRGRFTTPAQTFATTWLGYQYGWRPLMSTLYGLVDLQRNHAKSMRVKATSKRVTKRTELGFASGLPCTMEFEDIAVASVVVDVAVDSSILNDVSRLTTLNPAAIAWELVPYSFVVDWFFDIGRYLEELESSLAFGVGLRFKGGYTSHMLRTTVTTIIPAGKLVYPDGFKIEWQAMGQHEVQVYRDRVRLADLPTPFFPKFKVQLGWQRILSATALLANVFFKWPNPGRKRRN